MIGVWNRTYTWNRDGVQNLMTKVAEPYLNVLGKKTASSATAVKKLSDSYPPRGPSVPTGSIVTWPQQR
jgi:hypothetical protein